MRFHCYWPAASKGTMSRRKLEQIASHSFFLSDCCVMRESRGKGKWLGDAVHWKSLAYFFCMNNDLGRLFFFIPAPALKND